MTYQRVGSDRHIFSKAVEGPTLTPFEVFWGEDFQSKSLDFGTIVSHGVLVDADVGVTDRLALFGSAAMASVRYQGDDGEGVIDDGRFHTSLQDARLGARYLLDHDLWTVTPFAAASFPMTDYPIVGHASVGVGLKELELGTSVGRLLATDAAILGYLEGSYSYAFVEDPGDEVHLARSRARIELGYFLGPVTAQVLAAWQRVHGGIDPAFDIDQHSSEHDIHIHDQGLAIHEWRLGAGLSFPISEATAAYVSYSGLLWGENTHDAAGVVVGLNWTFQAFGGLNLGRPGN